LLKILAGFEGLDNGEINYQNKELKYPEDRYEKILFLGDEKILHSNLTGNEHLFLYRNEENQEAIQKLIHYYKMDSFLNKKIKTYSLGMKQMLLITLLVSAKSSIILFDEVLNGLDPLNAKKTLKLMNKLKDKKLIIISSHQLNELQEISDSTLFFKEGTLEFIEKIDKKSLKEMLLESLEEKNNDEDIEI
jgi:ABC-2 type transport system ATP-binding protein